MKLSIVLSTHTAQFNAIAYKGDFEANLAKIAAMGYDGVELAIRDPALVDPPKLETALKSHSLDVPAIGTGQAWSEERLSFTDPDETVRRKAVDRIKSQVRLAERLNALVIIGLIRGKTPAGQSQSQTRSYLIAGLRECTDYANKCSVRLAIEPINHQETDLIPTAGEALKLIQQVGASNLGLLLDTYHMHIEEKSIEATILEYGEHIYHFHVADSNRQHPGAGSLDFYSILRTLISTGYEGWISGEFLPLPDPDIASRSNINLLRMILS